VSFSSSDVQTSQPQATMGIPVLVPVPKKVIVNGGYATLQTYSKK
jgi:hypothetical protein